DRGDARTAGITGLSQLVHEILQPRHGLGIRDEEGILVHPVPRLERDAVGAELREIAAHDYAVLLVQPFPRDRGGRHAHRGLARRLPAAAAIVADAVLLPVRIVGVPGTEHILDFGVVLAARVHVAYEERERRA